MAAAAILKFCFNDHNSAIFARICIKFYIRTQNHVPETDLPSDLISNKIQDGGGRHVEIRINDYNSAVMAYISTKFDAVTENDVLDVVLPTKCTCDKIQDGGDSESDVSKIHVRLKSGHHIVIFIRYGTII